MKTLEEIIIDLRSINGHDIITPEHFQDIVRVVQQQVLLFDTNLLRGIPSSTDEKQVEQILWEVLEDTQERVLKYDIPLYTKYL